MSLIDLLTLPNVAAWMVILSFVGFVAMGVDKALARSNWGERISEKTLWFTALAGGFAGVIAGSLVFNHKTSKGEFWPPVVFAVILWVTFLVLLEVGHFP